MDAKELEKFKSEQEKVIEAENKRRIKELAKIEEKKRAGIKKLVGLGLTQKEAEAIANG